MKENKILTPLQVNELKDFIKENSYLIYEYINTEVLKNIGVMNQEYFLKVIKDIFNENTNTKINFNDVNTNIFPYYIFTLLSYHGKIDYTSFRTETINFSQINREASTYYNYVKFSLDNDFLTIALMQSKMGGMAVDEDIVKFKKEVTVKKLGLEEFINIKESYN